MGKIGILNAQTGDIRLLYSDSPEKDLLKDILGQACVDSYQINKLMEIRPLTRKEKTFRTILLNFFFSNDKKPGQTGWTLCALAPEISDVPDVLIEKTRKAVRENSPSLKLWTKHEITSGQNLKM